MAGDKRELILDLLARDKSGPATKAFGKNLDDVGDKAGRADDKLGKFGKTTETVGGQTDKLGRSAHGVGADISRLDAEISDLEHGLQGLARSFAQADGAASRLDISKSIRKAENDLRRLNKSKTILSSILPDPSSSDVQGWSKKFMTTLGGALASAGELAGNHVGATIGAAAGAAAAPVLIPALASALSAGVGALGIGAGILLAVKSDKGIQNAGKAAGSKFVDALSTAARGAFGGPILDSLHVLEDAGEHVAETWGRTFKALAPAILPLTKDLVQAGTRISDSLSGLAGKSGPALAGLGKSVVLLADGFGDFLDTVSDGSPEAAANLELLAGGTADLARSTGNFLSVLNKGSNNAWLTGPLIPLLRKHYEEAADATGTFAKRTKEVEVASDNAAKAAWGQRDALAGLSKEMKAESDPAFALLDAQDKLKDSQKALSAAVKDHGKKSEQARQATRDLAEAAIDLEGKAGALGGTFNGKLTPAMTNTLRAAGLTEAQIRGVGKEFGRAKNAGEAFGKNYRASVSVAGTEQAASRIKHVRDLLAQVRSKRISVSVLVADSQLDKVNNTLSRFGGARASGGPTAKDVPYWVGENGPELFVPHANGRVLSAGQSQAAAKGHSTGGLNNRAGGPQALRLELVGQSELVTMFRYLIRTANLLQDA